MDHLHLTHFIAAPAQVVFDLSRHIGLHQISQQKYKEEAVRGTRSGLVKKDDLITWRARHLGKIRFLTVKITQLETPLLIENTMTEGDFKSFVHRLHFKQIANGTIVVEELFFESPYGLLGRIFNTVFLRQYLTQLIQERTKVIKTYAEGNKWKALLQ
jgi:hypothetical protein